MRGTKLQGRFNLDYEAKSMYEGIAEDLGAPIGQEVDWFRWSPTYLQQHYTEIVDEIYDVSSDLLPTNSVVYGRKWAKSVKVPTVMAQLIRSTNVMNERGFYVTDTLRLVINVGDIQRLMPELLDNPSSHIKDRIVYKGEVFVPTRVLPRGAFGAQYAVLTVDCNQVNGEELVNDPEFLELALPVGVEPRDAV